MAFLMYKQPFIPQHIFCVIWHSSVLNPGQISQWLWTSVEISVSSCVSHTTYQFVMTYWVASYCNSLTVVESTEMVRNALKSAKADLSDMRCGNDVLRELRSATCFSVIWRTEGLCLRAFTRSLLFEQVGKLPLLFIQSWEFTLRND